MSAPRRREPVSAARVLLTVFAALAGAVVAFVATLLVLAWLLSGLAHRNAARPLSVGSSLLSLAVVTALTVGSVVIVATLIVRRCGWPGFAFPSSAGAVGYVVAFGLFHFLQVSPFPEQDLASILPGPRGDSAYDVMLVVDPNERAGRRLVERVRAHGAAALRSGAGTPPWNVAFGLTMVDRGGAWHRILAPTLSWDRLSAAIARLPETGVAVPTGTYGTAAIGLANARNARWRPDTQRAVIILHDGEPQPTEFGARRRLTRVERAMPLLAPTPPAITHFARLARSTIPIGYRPGAVGLYIAGGRAREPWSRWLAGAGGAVIETDGARAIDRIVEYLAGTSDPDMDRLATRFRPLLFFDRHLREPYRPLDVDAFLSEVDDGSPVHEACHMGFASLIVGCSPIRDGRVPSLANVLRLAAGAKIERDDERTPQRLYYHAVQQGRLRLQIDYWWFYRFNLSPFASRVMCVTGIGIADVSCYDHEGDWEGVTVTLGRRRPKARWVPQAVVYAGHHWSYRFTWPDLVRSRRTRGDHALVYVAFGSHASYPRPCHTPVSCHQPRRALPDGERDGETVWKYNDEHACRVDPCVAALPVDRNGGPALWSSFRGSWGAAYCVPGFKLCVRAAGPKSPYRQDRYVTPGVAEHEGRLDELVGRG